MELEEHIVRSEDCGFQRVVWYVPVVDAEGTCVFLDGEFYLRELDPVATFERLTAEGLAPRASLVFVSHVDAAHRHAELTCNRAFARFVAEDVLLWAARRAGTDPNVAQAICGLSLSGLQAAYTASSFPGRFDKVVAQSGSFWWLHGREFEWPEARGRFWLSVGDEETASGVSHPPSSLWQGVSQIDGVRGAAEMLEANGAEVKLRLYRGGHAMAPWKEELGDALTWIYAR
jgi:enterochelin esterase family protein